MLSITE